MLPHSGVHQHAYLQAHKAGRLAALAIQAHGHRGPGHLEGGPGFTGWRPEGPGPAPSCHPYPGFPGSPSPYRAVRGHQPHTPVCSGIALVGFPWLVRHADWGWLLGRCPSAASFPLLLVLCSRSLAPCLPAGQLVWCRLLLPPLLPPKPCRARLHLGRLGR